MPVAPPTEPSRASTGDTRDPAYSQRLAGLQGARWKRWLDVQRPYRQHLWRVCRGRVLEVGCGIGRNLDHLRRGGFDALGLDHNPDAVALCRARGLAAFTPQDLAEGGDAGGPGRVPPAAGGAFGTLLLSHVAEHLLPDEVSVLLARYHGWLEPGARLVLITPQEAGQASDATHRSFVDFALARRVAEAAGFGVEQQYSFPLPRWAGRVFKYNEFVTLARWADTPTTLARPATTRSSPSTAPRR